jgi:MATE family multidrug resistance protein
MLNLPAVKQEAHPMLALAGPVVLAELGWMAMGTVDTLMVGRLNPLAIGAVGIGHALFLVPSFFGVGLLLGLDTVVAQAFGARRLEDGHRALFQGVYLSLFLTPPLTGVALWVLAPLAVVAGVDPRVLRIALPYLETVTWSLLPLLLYTALRRYLQAVGHVRPVMIALVSANLVNAAANWVLIFGHLGAPALGVEGAAWATLCSRTYMMILLALAVVRHDHSHRTRLWQVPRRLEWARIRSLLRLGLPAALQITLEMGVFATATTLAGLLDPASLAAHQIALTAASVTYMVPLGVSAAGAVRVGQAVGRRDPDGAGASGFTALAGLLFLAFPEGLVRAFSSDRQVVAIGVRLLTVAAVFQLFDGIQVVTTGNMRGLGDTRTPMLANLAGHWLVGLPVGAGLCFGVGLGITGLWVGLCVGLIAVGGTLLLVFAGQVRRLPQRLTAQGTPGATASWSGLRKTTP